jgi:hypothetical protein
MENIKKYIKQNGYQKSELARRLSAFTGRKISRSNIDYYLNLSGNDIPDDVIRFFIACFDFTKDYIIDLNDVNENKDYFLGFDFDNIDLTKYIKD